MRCDGCSWLRPGGPVAATSAGSHRWPEVRSFPLLFLFRCSRHRNTVVSCSTSGMFNSYLESSIRSYSRRCYNPFSRREPSDHPPSSQIVRDWIDCDAPLASKERFMVVSYNILGDRNSSKHRDLYSNVPFPYLKWGYRKRVICDELIGFEPDIICMQEVDKYFDVFSVMEKAGYAGSYKRRTGDNVDGCAMFWKADKFQLLERQNIEFKRFGLRDNVAQLSVFQMCESKSRKLLVGNIHVLYSPSRGDVKLGQIRSLCSRAHLLSQKWGNIPVVLAGDFNSTPQSPLYNFLASSELNIIEHDRRELSGQRNCDPTQVLGTKSKPSNLIISISRNFNNFWTNEEIRVATGRDNSYWAVHPLKLRSSYATIKGSTKTRDSIGEPLATSYHSKFLGTVDYLWCSGGLIPVRVLDTLPIYVLYKTRGLPCQKMGSDHLALVSEFAFELEKVGKSTDAL